MYFQYFLKNNKICVNRILVFDELLQKLKMMIEFKYSSINYSFDYLNQVLLNFNQTITIFFIFTQEISKNKNTVNKDKVYK